MAAPYKEVIPEGTLFGAIHEAALQLDDRRLGLLVGMYGEVIECRPVSSGGANVRAKNGKLLFRKIVLYADTENGELDRAEESIRTELQQAGCLHVLGPDEYRKLLEEEEVDGLG